MFTEIYTCIIICVLQCEIAFLSFPQLIDVAEAVFHVEWFEPALALLGEAELLAVDPLGLGEVLLDGLCVVVGVMEALFHRDVVAALVVMTALVVIFVVGVGDAVGDLLVARGIDALAEHVETRIDLPGM